MPPHDNAYKHVFAHPRAVADLLEQRFGPLPAELVARIERAGLDQLRDGFTRILMAQTLAAVFAGQ